MYGDWKKFFCELVDLVNVFVIEFYDIGVNENG